MSSIPDSTMGSLSENSEKASISSNDILQQPSYQNAPYTAQEAADAWGQAESEIFPRDNDADSGYDDDMGSQADSMSLASSVRTFTWENGRRYHGYRAGQYNFPNDDTEQDREVLKHIMFLRLFNSNMQFAPLHELKGTPWEVLDIGTGTGSWALDFADLHDYANVIGIDLSPIQTQWVPPNLKFMVDDAELEWIYPPDHFDFVHTRHMVTAIRKWDFVIESAFRHIKPGGWLELHEIDHMPQSLDGTLAPNSYLLQYWMLITEACKNMRLDVRPHARLANAMRAAGFINVTERIFFTPIGPWAKNPQLREVGHFWRAVLLEGLESIALGPLTRGLNWSREEVEVLVAETRTAYMDRKIHSYMPFHVIYGQKPEVGTSRPASPAPQTPGKNSTAERAADDATS